MKKECETLFIELIAPYLTALEATKCVRKEDWHAVFGFSQALEHEIQTSRAGDFVKLRDKVGRLADLAVNQSSMQMHGKKTSGRFDSDALFLLGEIQGEIRKVLIDNVCLCESESGTLLHQVGKFPKQDKALATLQGLSGGYKIVQVHDDGDLTIESDGQQYVVTTDGGLSRKE